MTLLHGSDRQFTILYGLHPMTFLDQQGAGAGIVVNNSIVLIDFTNQLRSEGLDKFKAVMESCSVRLRPILMTTSTTVLGLLPMALSWGEGSELRVPLAITIIGGLITSTLLTLVLVPVLYTIVVREKKA